LDEVVYLNIFSGHIKNQVRLGIGIRWIKLSRDVDRSEPREGILRSDE
jgi:hypothetical protein